jgi:1-acyl-sn-glycerol-3-phosphate acyltransferase
MRALRHFGAFLGIFLALFRHFVIYWRSAGLAFRLRFCGSVAPCAASAVSKQFFNRRPPGAPPEYRHGSAQVYSGLDVPCLPIGLNAGLYWPRRSLKLRTGKVIVEILPPIPSGLDRAVFFARMQDEIEQSSNRLLAEGRAALDETTLSR